MTLLQNGAWFVIDAGIAIVIGLLVIWFLVKYTGKHKVSRSEILIEKAFEAIKDLEDYYDLYPAGQRERNLQILKGMAIDLAHLDREAIVKKLEKEK